MTQRTAPTDAVERLAWILTFHEGETVSVNHLAEACGLSWATVRKYTQLLDVLGNIAPGVALTDEGVSVDAIAPALRHVSDQDDLSVLLYLLTVADASGDLLADVDRAVHERVLEPDDDTLESLAEHGLVSLTAETAALTPAGVSIIAPVRARLRAGTVPLSDVPPNPTVILGDQHRDASDSYDSDGFDDTPRTEWERRPAAMELAGD